MTVAVSPEGEDTDTVTPEVTVLFGFTFSAVVDSACVPGNDEQSAKILKCFDAHFNRLQAHFFHFVQQSFHFICFRIKATLTLDVAVKLSSYKLGTFDSKMMAHSKM